MPHQPHQPTLPLHYIDNTILSGWKKCRLAGWLRYGLGYTRDGSEIGPKRGNLKMLLGSAAHEAVAEWFVSQNIVKAMGRFQALYRPAVTIPPEDDRYTWDNARDVMAAWLYAQQAAPMRFTPYHAWIENAIETRLTNDAEEALVGYRIIFVSRPDAVGHLPNLQGSYTLETKTTGQYLNEDWATQWQKSSQLTSQIWAVGQVTGERPAGAYVNAIGVVKLPSGATKCNRGRSPHHVPYNECRLAHASQVVYGPFLRSDEALEKWRKDAVACAEEYIWYQTTLTTLDHLPTIPEDGAFDAGGACRFCEWQAWCAGGKDPALIHSGGHDPWDPRLGAKGLHSVQAREVAGANIPFAQWLDRANHQ